MKINLTGDFEKHPETEVVEMTQYGVRYASGKEIWVETVGDNVLYMEGVGRVVIAGQSHGSAVIGIQSAASAIRKKMAELGQVGTEPPFTRIERKVTVIVHQAIDSPGLPQV